MLREHYWPNRRHAQIELGIKERNGKLTYGSPAGLFMEYFSMTPADSHMNLRGSWGEVIIDRVGIGQRKTVYCESTVHLGLGFMGYANCM